MGKMRLIVNTSMAAGNFYSAQKSKYLRKFSKKAPIYKVTPTKHTLTCTENRPFVYMQRTPRYMDCTVLGIFDTNKFGHHLMQYIRNNKLAWTPVDGTTISIHPRAMKSGDHVFTYSTCAVHCAQSDAVVTLTVFGVCHAVRVYLKLSGATSFLLNTRVKEGTPVTIQIPTQLFMSGLELTIARVKCVHMPFVSDLAHVCTEQITPGKQVWAAHINTVDDAPVYAVVVQNTTTQTIQCIHRACQGSTFDSVDSCMQHYKHIRMPPGIRFTYVSMENGQRKENLDRKEAGYRLCYSRKKSVKHINTQLPPPKKLTPAPDHLLYTQLSHAVSKYYQSIPATHVNIKNL
jgi:hypothetical protein